MTSIVLPWAKFKEFLETWKIKATVRYAVDAIGTFHIWVKLDGEKIEVSEGLEAGSSDLADFQTNYIPLISKNPNAVSVSEQPAFAAKTFGSKKLFKRVQGMIGECIAGSNTFLFTVPFPWVKITGIELVNGEPLDRVSFFILDSTTGSITGVPNYVLNQFGFDVVVSKDYYEHKSEFDADLYAGMQIKMVYTSLSIKTIGVNFILNEVK